MILLETNSFPWNVVTALVAIIVSIIALLYNRYIAQRNTRLSIQQILIKTISDKVKDCNEIWQNKGAYRKPNFELISEIIISIEIIEKSIEIYKVNYEKIDLFRNDFYYLFWKQLRTDLRSFIMSTRQIAEQENNDHYTRQIIDIHKTFQDYFESRK